MIARNKKRTDRKTSDFKIFNCLIKNLQILFLISGETTIRKKYRYQFLIMNIMNKNILLRL